MIVSMLALKVLAVTGNCMLDHSLLPGNGVRLGVTHILIDISGTMNDGNRSVVASNNEALVLYKAVMTMAFA